MENTPKTLLKIHLASQSITDLFFNCVFFQFSSRKNSIDCGIFNSCLCNRNFPWWKGENSSFDIKLMHKQLLVCFQFLNTNKRFYRCRSIPLFFDVHCICWEAYFHDDIKSDDGYFMANCSGCSEVPHHVH